MGARDFDRMTLPRKASNLLTARLQTRFGVKLPDVQCGFRAIRADALQHIQLRQDGYPWACEMLIEAKKQGLKMEPVPIETIRGLKSEIKPLRDTLEFLYMLLT